MSHLILRQTPYFLIFAFLSKFDYFDKFELRMITNSLSLFFHSTLNTLCVTMDLPEMAMNEVMARAKLFDVAKRKEGGMANLRERERVRVSE